MAELDGTINSSNNASFVVNLLQQHNKKTPAGTKFGGTKVNSCYRTIEEAKVRGSS